MSSDFIRLPDFSGDDAKRMRFWRIGAGILALTTVAFIIATIVLATSKSPQAPPKDITTTPLPLSTSPRPVCQTDGCKEVGKFLSANINPNVDPCDDFYEYACGNWIKTHPIPAHQGSASIFGDLYTTEVNQTAKGILKVTDADPQALRTTKTFYESCMHANTSEKSVLDLLMDFGGWPAIGQHSTAFSTERAVGRVNGEQAVPNMVTVSIDVDWRNVSRYIVYIDQATLGLGLGSEVFYTNASFADILEAYRMSIVSTMETLAMNRTREEIEHDANRTLAMEVEMARMNIPLQDRRNYTQMYQLVTVEKLTKTYAFWNWTELLLAYLPEHVGSEVVCEKLEVVLSNPAFLDDFNEKILKMFNSTEQQNYLLWRLAQPQLMFLDDRFKKILLDLNRARFGVEAMPPTVETCVSTAIALLPWSTGRLFVNEAFPVDGKKDAQLFIQSVLSSVSSLFIGIQWMDVESKLNAERKESGYVKNAVFPDWIYDNTALDAYYDSLSLSSSEEFFNVLQNVTAWTQAKMAQRLLAKIVDREDFQMSPALLNAWYNPWLNSITIPAGILQPPFYRKDFPMAVNYGGIGVVMGHEISHGFDDEGVQFFDNGTLHTWMTDASQRGFRNMSACVVREYDKFCYPELKLCVDGENTQGENIADNAGVRASFLAYMEYVFSHGAEDAIPGLEEYDSRQVFFLSYGSLWCENKRNEALEDQLVLDVHSPGRERINGVLQNFEPFAQAFRCAKGRRMTPRDACVVW